MAHRFYVEQLPTRQVRVTLGRKTVRHLDVLGLSEGSEVVLFDGTGREVLARIERMSHGSAEAVVVSRDEVSAVVPFGKLRVNPIHRDFGGVGPEAGVALTLACAVPKGRRMDTLVRMCAEMGVRSIVPMVTGRSVVRPPTSRDGRSHKGDRWHRICVAASEQSGRRVLTGVEPTAELTDVLDRAGSFDLTVILSPDADAPSLAELLAARPDLRSLLLLVGPEGGFTDEEMQAARRRGVTPARLVRAVLRVETACVAAAAVALSILS